jgi:pimeloyl-ACP methyl ester carboxylesterase
MIQLEHKFVETNGVQMHYVQAGKGPVVILCHGFPESWYSWRHQINALAEAGYQVVAPDQRGYGQTSAPQPIEAYNIFNLVGDIVGLANALGASASVIVGHDWGAPVAWHCAILRPDLFRACALLSVPYLPRAPIKPSVIWTAIEGNDHTFYQHYFQEPGRAEADFEADVHGAMKKMLYGASGAAPVGVRFEHLFPRGKRPLEMIAAPAKLPAWLTEADLDFFTGEFKRSGLRGGLNWYRNIDRNWELTAFLDGAKLRQPSMFAAGEHDVVLRMIPGALELVDSAMPACKNKVVIPEAGHWIQQERPAEINRLLLDFLADQR